MSRKILPPAADKTAGATSAAGGRRVPSRIPSEAVNETSFATQTRSFGDCYRWSLEDAERRQWCWADPPALAALRVFSCGLFVEACGHWWERAKLPEGILIYCTEGRGHYRQDDEQWDVHPGDLVYCAPNTHHRYWAAAAQPWTIYWMHLSGKQLPYYERLLGLLAGGPVRHIGVHDGIIAEFTRLIILHPLANSEKERFCIQANVIAILGRIAALPNNIADIAAAYGQIQKAITLMNAEVDHVFDLPRFAGAAGCGRRHFIRQFRRVTGLPPGEWFIRRKVQRAKMLLTLPDIQIKGVAFRLGYADPLYFSRIFKRVVGVSPEVYRRKMAHDRVPEELPE